MSQLLLVAQPATVFFLFAASSPFSGIVWASESNRLCKIQLVREWYVCLFPSVFFPSSPSSWYVGTAAIAAADVDVTNS